MANKAKLIKPSKRSELEITSLNDIYLKEKSLKGIVLGRGFAWFDTGTIDSLIETAVFVQVTEKRTGAIISAPEEIAFKNGWINKDELMHSSKKYGKSPYGKHLENIAIKKFKY